MQLSEAIDGYLLDRSLSMSETTLDGYRVTFRRLVEFTNDTNIEDITANDIRKFLAHIQAEYNLSERSIHDAYVDLSSLWTWANDELEIEHILRKISRPTFTKKIIQPLTKEEVKALLENLERTKPRINHHGQRRSNRRDTARRDKAIVLVLLDCGPRISELLDLNVEDYNRKKGTLFIARGKGNKERIVAIGTRSRKALWRYLASRPDRKPDEPLFTVRNGGRLTRHTLAKILRDAGRKSDINGVGAHRLRHTFAVNFLRNGGNVLELKAMLGHESIQMLQVYVLLAEVDIIDAQKRASPADNWKL